MIVANQSRHFKSVLWQESHMCLYCRKLLTFKTATLDHIIPISRGGKTELNNLALACSPCNNAKDHLTPDQFSAFRKRHESRRRIYKKLAKQAPHKHQHISKTPTPKAVLSDDELIVGLMGPVEK